MGTNQPTFGNYLQRHEIFRGKAHFLERATGRPQEEVLKFPRKSDALLVFPRPPLRNKCANGRIARRWQSQPVSFLEEPFLCCFWPTDAALLEHDHHSLDWLDEEILSLSTPCLAKHLPCRFPALANLAQFPSKTGDLQLSQVEIP